ncbi:uncharacterized protein EI90DRAFT_1353725 [Cantharellus anzutake]|uniref:uncharacterized protein n=1 Tax=Cantharellus anzutake TaxID=1750568 RepID=UPI0019045C9B|nr:uncharacterized protein EI90DRAFT_1353725 [Cantharellus anzutake]KAF8329847.1 hypothetical protein EI90DRAFT_1353725 [Cantharellus anzutake]
MAVKTFARSSPRWLSTWALPVIIWVLDFVPLSWAQNTSVTCGSDWKWAENSRGQNPCGVAAYLLEVCYYPRVYSVPPLPNGTHYIGPTSDPSTQNQCVCSTPVYQLMSACGACQSLNYLHWNEWSFNCPSYGIALGHYPYTIPGGTAVPFWALTDPAQWGGTFNAELAKVVGDTPELTASNSTSTPAPSSTATLPPSSSAVPTFTSHSNTSFPNTTPSTTSSSNRGSGSTNVGAIAGGVAGGIVGLGLIAAVVYISLRRIGPAVARSDLSTHVTPYPTTELVEGDTSFANTRGVSTGDETSAQQSSEVVLPLKLYDPNDPSTFPRTPDILNVTALSPSNSLSYGATRQSRPDGHSRGGSDDNKGGYSGMPEL